MQPQRKWKWKAKTLEMFKLTFMKLCATVHSILQMEPRGVVTKIVLPTLACFLNILFLNILKFLWRVKSNLGYISFQCVFVKVCFVWITLIVGLSQQGWQGCRLLFQKISKLQKNVAFIKLRHRNTWRSSPENEFFKKGNPKTKSHLVFVSMVKRAVGAKIQERC